MKRNLILTLLAILFTCCTSSNKQMVDKHTTIDSTWQKQCTTILSDKMQELDALYGDVIIMECKTGEIKAMGCLAKDSKGNLVGSNRLAQATGLMRSVSLLAALESGKINVDDHVDTKNGVIQLNNNLLRDHNWRRGGYGKITIQNGFLKSSILSTYLTILFRSTACVL
jgi:cell division protein FtsI (penicillin-binding protein 3)